MRVFIPAVLVTLSLGTSAVAVAADVVLPPLVPRTGTEIRDVANVTALMSTELDFMAEVENVIELPKIPVTLTATCLDQSGCLAAIGKQGGGTHLMAGTLRVTPEKITLDLVYFDVVKGRNIRRQAFELVNRPEIIADNMDDVMREMVTGQAPKTEEVASKSADSFNLMDFDEDEDLGFDQKDFSAAAQAEAERKAAAEAEAQRRVEEQARLAAQAEARRRAEEQARLAAEAEARRKAEEQARLAAEAEARRRAEAARLAAEAEAKRKAEESRLAAEAEARRKAEAARIAAASRPPEPAEEEFDPSMISFGSAAILVEDPPVASVPSPPTPRTVQTPPASKPSYYRDEEEEIAELDEPSRRDLDIEADEDVEPSRSKPATVSKPAAVSKPAGAEPRTATKGEDTGVERVGTSKPASSGSTRAFDDQPTSLQIAVRGGYSPYYNLGFVTAGGEVAAALGDSGVHALFGVEAWSVNRQVPPEYQVVAGATTQWNTIYPVSLGVVYKLGVGEGRVKPYAGADLITAQYYVPPGPNGVGTGPGKWTVGARARGGVDVMVHRSFGLNLNVAVGGWSGGDWEIIQKDVRNAGLLPQVSAGTVVAF